MQLEDLKAKFGFEKTKAYKLRQRFKNNKNLCKA